MTDASAAGQLALRLAARSDLVMESFRPGVAARLGLSYDDVRALRPDVLYCSVSAFGQTGPYASRPGFDIMAQGVTGVLRMTGQPGGRPAKVGFAVNDIAAGMTAVQSVLAAQLVRAATGTGQYIDVAMADSLLAWTVWEAGAFFGAGERAAARRDAAPAVGAVPGIPHQGRVHDHRRLHRPALGAHRARARRAAVARRPAVRHAAAAGPRHIGDLEALIEAVTVTRTTAEWLAVLDEAGVPAGPVLRYDEALGDEQLRAREMIVEMDHPLMGRVRNARPARQVQRLPPGAYDRPAPWLGQHTAQVLGDELGVSRAELEELTRAGIVRDKHPEAEP